MTFQPSSPTAEAQGRSAEGPSAFSSDMSAPEIGATARRTRTVTGRDIELFTEISGDRNPIHYDADARRDAAGSAGSSCRAA